MPPTPSVTHPVYPGTMIDKDLAFVSLVEGMIADDIYFGIGTYTDLDIAAHFINQTALNLELSTSYDILGELAEKPGKTDSKITKLKTRNYSIPGKRTSTIELSIEVSL